MELWMLALERQIAVEREAQQAYQRTLYRALRTRAGSPAGIKRVWTFFTRFALRAKPDASKQSRSSSSASAK